MIEKLVRDGCKLDIQTLLSGDIHVRVTTSGGQVGTGQGATIPKAIVNALMVVIDRLDKVLIETEADFQVAEEKLHYHGFMINMLDETEVERFEERKKKRGDQG